MKPPIYGYLRVTREAQEAAIRQAESDLRRYAEAEGFCFAALFHDYDAGGHAAFNELTEELKRADAHHVIVPSLAHLADHPILLDCMLTYLDLYVDAQVLVLSRQ